MTRLAVVSMIGMTSPRERRSTAIPFSHDGSGVVRGGTLFRIVGDAAAESMMPLCFMRQP
jgi:hypothetical protein